ncbi:MAG: MBL fold metallo-hydrolase [Proteobacteria bacterium]|nr:MBL fold metallo-hydrolase [Pseudomonadota bacterium]
MHLIIHRGARQVGGSCVELNFNASTILLDIGLPLDSDFSDDPESYLPQPLFNELKNGKKEIDAVILSHAHLDHYGLAGMLPQGVPVYCGKASAELMAITGQMSPEKAQPLELKFFKAWKKFQAGTFSVMPYLMDHSAFDAYGFLISAGGKSLFYTGDFRGHGRKAKLPQASWAKIRVCYPQLLARRFEKLGLKDILVRHRKNGINWDRIREMENNAVMLIRAGFLYDIKRFLGLEGATWIYSLWTGYFERSKSLRNLKSYLEDKGVRYKYLHTSGHAKLDDLKKLVDAMAPKMVIPIHSFYPDKFKDYFPNARIVEDGEVVNL